MADIREFFGTNVILPIKHRLALEPNVCLSALSQSDPDGNISIGFDKLSSVDAEQILAYYKTLKANRVITAEENKRNQLACVVDEPELNSTKPDVPVVLKKLKNPCKACGLVTGSFSTDQNRSFKLCVSCVYRHGNRAMYRTPKEWSELTPVGDSGNAMYDLDVIHHGDSF